ncbi:MAG: hypothetical protein CMJ64_17085 [Planctomycetaceae bacterium]|nr:hypothetical protein [Planctomycetaceae bacterium]
MQHTETGFRLITTTKHSVHSPIVMRGVAILNTKVTPNARIGYRCNDLSGIASFAGPHSYCLRFEI